MSDLEQRQLQARQAPAQEPLEPFSEGQGTALYGRPAQEGEQYEQRVQVSRGEGRAPVRGGEGAPSQGDEGRTEAYEQQLVSDTEPDVVELTQEATESEPLPPGVLELRSLANMTERYQPGEIVKLGEKEYIIHNYLSQGGLSQIYWVYEPTPQENQPEGEDDQDPTEQRDYKLIKITKIDPNYAESAADKLRSEGKIIQQLNDAGVENIPQVYDMGETENGELFAQIMSYDGRPVKELLGERNIEAEIQIIEQFREIFNSGDQQQVDNLKNTLKRLKRGLDERIEKIITESGQSYESLDEKGRIDFVRAIEKNLKPTDIYKIYSTMLEREDRIAFNDSMLTPEKREIYNQVFKDYGRTLDQMGELGIVHNDVKLGNFLALFSDDQSRYLGRTIDFGVVKHSQDYDENTIYDPSAAEIAVIPYDNREAFIEKNKAENPGEFDGNIVGTVSAIPVKERQAITQFFEIGDLNHLRLKEKFVSHKKECAYAFVKAGVKSRLIAAGKNPLLFNNFLTTDEREMIQVGQDDYKAQKTKIHFLLMNGYLDQRAIGAMLPTFEYDDIDNNPEGLMAFQQLDKFVDSYEGIAIGLSKSDKKPVEEFTDFVELLEDMNNEQEFIILTELYDNYDSYKTMEVDQALGMLQQKNINLSRGEYTRKMEFMAKKEQISSPTEFAKSLLTSSQQQ
jgi:serine/threonine protein kinase